eukprot:4324690-Pleurochrysis_carterae.AAC.2
MASMQAQASNCERALSGQERRVHRAHELAGAGLRAQREQRARRRRRCKLRVALPLLNVVRLAVGVRRKRPLLPRRDGRARIFARTRLRSPLVRPRAWGAHKVPVDGVVARADRLHVARAAPLLAHRVAAKGVLPREHAQLFRVERLQRRCAACAAVRAKRRAREQSATTGGDAHVHKQARRLQVVAALGRLARVLPSAKEERPLPCAHHPCGRSALGMRRRLRPPLGKRIVRGAAEEVVVRQLRLVEVKAVGRRKERFGHRWTSASQDAPLLGAPVKVSIELRSGIGDRCRRRDCGIDSSSACVA